MTDHMLYWNTAQVLLFGSWGMMFIMLAVTVFHRSMLTMLAGFIVSMSALFLTMGEVGWETLRLIPLVFMVYFMVRLIAKR